MTGLNVISGWVFLFAAASASAQPATPPAGEPAAPVSTATIRVVDEPEGDEAAADASAPDLSAPDLTTAEGLLEALEAAGHELRSLAADIQYTRVFGVAGDTQTRVGQLLFVSTPPPAGAPANEPPDRRFAVRFDTLIVGGRKEDSAKTYVFDGEWLTEVDEREKSYQRRQVVPPGERIDPLRIGEGPFPVPLAQAKRDILARFTAEIRPSAEGLDAEPGLAKFAERLTQLRLVPRPGTQEADEFDEVRVWYDTASPFLTPRIARTVNVDLDESLVVLLQPQLNGSVDGRVLDPVQPPEAAGWTVSVQPYRGPDEEPAGAGGR